MNACYVTTSGFLLIDAQLEHRGITQVKLDPTRSGTAACSLRRRIYTPSAL
jgi:hypothetical protein